MYRYQKQNAIASDKTKTPARRLGFVCVVPLQAGHAAIKTGLFRACNSFYAASRNRSRAQSIHPTPVLINCRALASLIWCLVPILLAGHFAP